MAPLQMGWKGHSSSYLQGSGGPAPSPPGPHASPELPDPGWVSLDPALQAAPALAEALRYPAGLESAAPLLIQH